MASHGSLNEKTGAGERGSRMMRNIHWALGGLALGASVVVAPAVMQTFAVWEGIHGGIWEGARRHFVKKRQAKSHS